MRNTAIVALMSLALMTAAGCDKEPSAAKPEAPVPRPAPETPKAPAIAPAPAAEVKAVGWRGDGSGVYADADPVSAWDSDEKKGVLWKVKIGTGYSSPVATGNRVFVAVEQEKLVCVDATTRKVLWEKNNGFEDLPKDLGVEEKRYPTSAGFATPTPVTDGKHVWASFGTGIVACYDLDGNRKWIVWLNNPQQVEYGRCASPVLVEGKLVVTAGHLVALDPATGKTLWTCEDAAESYGTPAVARIGPDGIGVLITATGDVVRVSNGEAVDKGLASCSYNSPVVSNGVVYFIDGRSVAFKLPGKLGEKAGFKKLWQTDLEGEFYSSPVVKDGIVYGAANDGFLHAVDAEKGAEIYKQQLDMASAAAMPGMPPGNLYPSLAVAGGKLFVSNDRGQTIVVEPGRTFKQIAKNYIEEGTGAGPAFSGKLLYLRGGEDLYCVGKADAK
jgi:outer membrane protein assembly factor BamB